LNAKNQKKSLFEYSRSRNPFPSRELSAAWPISFSSWMGKVVSDESTGIVSEAKDLVGMSRFTYGREDPSLRSAVTVYGDVSRKLIAPE
jgi:hypothetical protein